MSPAVSRYAIYLAPEEDTPLWRFGSVLLGYDAARGIPLTQPTLRGFDPEAIARLTAEPRRYGFHMTLKAPLRLAPGTTEAELQRAMDDFAGKAAPFDTGPLALEARPAKGDGDFLSLVPARRCEALQQLESAVVPAFDRFRAPLSPEDRARRRPETLSQRQRDLLETYGYPYVLDEFRPHFTLTGPTREAGRLREAILPILAEIGEPAFACRGLTLFRQLAPDQRFRLISRHRFG